MLLSLFMTRTVLILGLASKGLFKGRLRGWIVSLSLSLLCDALSRNRLKTGGSNLHHPGGGGWVVVVVVVVVVVFLDAVVASPKG